MRLEERRLLRGPGACISLVTRSRGEHSQRGGVPPSYKRPHPVSRGAHHFTSVISDTVISDCSVSAVWRYDVVNLICMIIFLTRHMTQPSYRAQTEQNVLICLLLSRQPEQKISVNFDRCVSVLSPLSHLLSSPLCLPQNSSSLLLRQPRLAPN